MALFLLFSMVLNLSIFWQFSDGIAWAFDRSGATRTVTLVTSKVFDRVWDAGFFHKFKSYGISSLIFGLISSFLSKNSFEWIWMGGLHKNIKLMLKFIKAQFLVIPFSYYTSMTFLMMLYVILLSILMILLSIQVPLGIWTVAQTRIAFWTWIVD